MIAELGHYALVLALLILRVLTRTAHQGLKQLSQIALCHCPACDEMTSRAHGLQEIRE